VAGRPLNFSGAIGSGFRIQMRAAPRQLQAEEPLILTVTITAPAGVQEIQRPNLRRLPRFDEQFQIENLTEHYLPAERAHEFNYRLRPRSAAVKEIPHLPFVFFNPKIVPPEKGYQTTLATAIPLTVRPRAAVSPGRVEGTVPVRGVPDTVYPLVEGSAVLRREPSYALPGPVALGGLLLGPPVVGGFWYIVRRRRYPNAVRHARTECSRAAQHALKALHRLGKRDAVVQARQAEAILAGYLRQRLDLHMVEPTPAEVAHHLAQAGSSAAFTQEMVCFFTDCNAARFAPGLLKKADHWAEKAGHLVLASEEESWP
jgi:hypothetical protein